MAKKLILACLTLVIGSFLEAGSPGSGNGRHELGKSHSAPGSPAAGVYVRMGTHGTQHATLRIDTDLGTSGAAGCRSWLPTRRTVDRVVYGVALIGIGVTIGITAGMCSEMKGACSEAQGELGRCNALLAEVSRLGALVCKLDPSLCLPK